MHKLYYTESNIIKGRLFYRYMRRHKHKLYYTKSNIIKGRLLYRYMRRRSSTLTHAVLYRITHTRCIIQNQAHTLYYTESSTHAVLHRIKYNKRPPTLPIHKEMQLLTQAVLYRIKCNKRPPTLLMHKETQLFTQLYYTESKSETVRGPKRSCKSTHKGVSVLCLCTPVLPSVPEM